MLKVEGWHVNHKQVERIWRQEGLKVPKRQKKRGRLSLNDGSCIRLRPHWRNHVWAYDFVADRLLDGTKIRFLTVVDEYTCYIELGSPWENGYNESLNGLSHPKDRPKRRHQIR